MAHRVIRLSITSLPPCDRYTIWCGCRAWLVRQYRQCHPSRSKTALRSSSSISHRPPFTASQALLLETPRRTDLINDPMVQSDEAEEYHFQHQSPPHVNL